MSEKVCTLMANSTHITGLFGEKFVKEYEGNQLHWYGELDSWQPRENTQKK